MTTHTTRLCPSCKKRPCECVTNTANTPPMNEVAKRCEIAAIKRGLADDNGQLRNLLEEAGYEIERLARENGRLKK
jgi:hypothetical protein